MPFLFLEALEKEHIRMVGLLVPNAACSPSSISKIHGSDQHNHGLSEIPRSMAVLGLPNLAGQLNIIEGISSAARCTPKSMFSITPVKGPVRGGINHHEKKQYRQNQLGSPLRLKEEKVSQNGNDDEGLTVFREGQWTRCSRRPMEGPGATDKRASFLSLSLSLSLWNLWALNSIQSFVPFHHPCMHDGPWHVSLDKSTLYKGHPKEPMNLAQLGLAWLT